MYPSANHEPQSVSGRPVAHRIFHKIVDSLPEHVAVMDHTSTIVFVNRAWKAFADENHLKMENYGVGICYIDLCDNVTGTSRKQAKNVAAQIRSLLAGRIDSFTVDYPCHSPQTQRWFRLNLTWFKAEGKRWAVAVHENITKLMESSLALEKNEAKLKGILESVPDAMCMFDPELNIVWANEPAKKIFGPDMEKKKCFRTLKHAGAPCGSCIVRKTFENGRVHTGEHTHRDVENRYRTFLCQTSIAGYAPDGTPDLVMETLHDITVRKKNEDQIRRLSQAVEQSPVSVVVTDLNGEIEYVNPKFEQVTGYTSAEALGQNPRILNTGKQSPEFYNSLWQTIKSGQVWHGEFENRKKDGTLYWESASISPIFNDHKEIVSFVAIKEDITARKKMIQDLRKAKSRAESSTKAKSDFLATMSHEIRTPLNSILGMSRLAMESGLAQAQHRRISNIHSAGNALLAILNDILDFSKIDAGKMSIKQEEFQLGDIMERIVTVMKFTALEKNILFSYSFSHGLPLFMTGDASRVTQIIMKIAGNALKYTSAGQVEILSEIIERTDKSLWLKITVKDTGIGMSDNQLSSLFEPFTQIDGSSSRIYGGTGLGLAIVKKITDAMEGSIEVQSSPGQGSVFSVSLPFAPALSSRIPGLPVEILAEKTVYIIDDPDGPAAALKSNLNALGMQPAVYPDKPFSDPLDFIIISQEWLDRDRLNDNAEKNLQAVISVKSKETKSLVIHHPETEPLCESRCRALLGDRNESLTFIEYPVPPMTLIRTLLSLLDDSGHPLVKTTDHQDRQPAADNDKQSLAGKKILVVDDDPINREIVTAIIEKAGADIYEAGNGETAVEMLSQSRFHMVFMDLEMPGMDGYETTRQIRALLVPWASTVPIVTLSGHDPSGIKDRCQEAGMNDCLTKPVKKETLSIILNKWLKGTSFSENKGKQPAELIDTDLIDTTAGLAYVDDQKSLYIKMLKKFTTTYDQVDQTIITALENGDSESIRFSAHNLSSIGTMIGARSLGDSARKLLVRLDEIHQTGEPVNVIKDNILSFCRLIRQVLDTAGSLAAVMETATPELEADMLSLLDAIQKQQPSECRDLLARIKTYDISPALKKRLEAIEPLIDRYRFADAEQKLARLSGDHTTE